VRRAYVICSVNHNNHGVVVVGEGDNRRGPLLGATTTKTQSAPTLESAYEGKNSLKNVDRVNKVEVLGAVRGSVWYRSRVQ